MDVGAGGRKGDDSGVIAMSWARVDASGVLPGVWGGRVDVISSVSVVLPTSFRRASYGEGYSAKVAVTPARGCWPAALARGVL